MKNKNKGFGLIGVLLIIVAALAVGGVAYSKMKNSASTHITPAVSPSSQKTGTSNSQLPENQNNNVTPTPVPAPTPVISSTLSLTGSDTGKTITATKGQTITVTLCNPGDGGYKFDAPQYSSSILKLTSHKNISANNPPGYVGGCYGNDVFEFKTLSSGTSKLDITASQPWTGGEKLSPMFSVTISVRSSVPSTSTTLLTPYISAQQNWPPVIQTSATAYSCTSAHSEMGNTVEKTINSKTYCITTASDGTAGSIYYTYTYTTSSGTGTKTTNFILRYVDCGVYSDPQMTQCKTAQSGFNLDAIIVSLM